MMPLRRVGNVVTASNKNPLIKLFDPISSVTFVIDTGSQISVLPVKRKMSHVLHSGFVHSADGSKIPTFEKVELDLSFNLDRVFKWKFIRASVQHPILGIDFLRHFDLTIDVKRNCLIDLTKFRQEQELAMHGSNAKTKSSSSIDDSKVTTLKELCDVYTPIFDLANFNQFRPNQTQHFIQTKGPPVFSRARRLSPERLLILKRELKGLLDLGIIEPSSGAWASPVHLVEKKQPGTFRVTGDFRLLNEKTKMDRYGLPYLTDFANNLDGCSHFTSLDLYKSYHQINLAPEDRVKTAINTPLGKFQFCRLAMGLKNASQAFQRLMDSILGDLEFVFVYIDDILIASKDREEHLRHLKIVFSRLHQYGLILNKEKCVFDTDTIEFLGHSVSKCGIRPLESKVEAIRNFKEPANMKELRRYLGMINFYRRFIPHCAEILRPLHELLSPKKNSYKRIKLNSDEKKAFNEIKNKLSCASLLAFPKLHEHTRLYVDASNFAVGGAIVQANSNGDPRPIAFFSKTLSPAQKSYSAFDRELLAICLAIKHFRYFLEGREFTIYTDHKPLIAAISAPLKDATSFQTRQLAFISQFSTDICWIEGPENVVADCLSRQPEYVPTQDDFAGTEDGVKNSELSQINILFGPDSYVDYVSIAHKQADDSSIEHLRNNSMNLDIVKKRIPNTDIFIWGDMSTNSFRPLIPLPFRKLIFDKMHGLCHPGIRGTQRLIAERFYWNTLKSDVKLWTESCVACQQAKIIRHNQAALQKFKTPGARFESIHVDLVGPLSESSGYTYLLTVICRFSRWFECIPMSEVTAQACWDSLNLHWIARFGCPQEIVTDRGGQFTSALWKDICQLLDIKLKHSCSYHPQSNGLVERLHRTLKTSLKAQENPSSWYSNLGYVLLGMRSALKSDLGCSVAELTLGIRLRLPGEFFLQENVNDCIQHNYTQYRNNLSNFLNSLKTSVPRESNSRKEFISKLLTTCSHVFVRQDGRKHPLQRAYYGPFPVLARSPKYFTLLMDNRCEQVSIDRLKAAKLLIGNDQETGTSAMHNSNNDEMISLDDTDLFSEASPNEQVEQTCDLSTNEPHADAIDERNTPEIKQTRLGRNIVKPIRFRKSL